ncbi:hypothetical protein CH294_21025 [Rhodococcus sp. 14-2483-1-1]|nr:hypothetical protein CH294_21025 [Rhodococcus sp. 14-2483-1-1]
MADTSNAFTKQKFGTDIHRHTVEFSKNTHTPFTNEQMLVDVRGNRSSLDQMIEHSQTGFSSKEVEPCGSTLHVVESELSFAQALRSGLASVSL